MSPAPAPPFLPGYIGHERFSDLMKSNTVGAEYVCKLAAFRATSRMGLLPRLTFGRAKGESTSRFGSIMAEVKNDKLDIYHETKVGRYGYIRFGVEVDGRSGNIDPKVGVGFSFGE